jgi:hypothetical protein
MCLSWMACVTVRERMAPEARACEPRCDGGPTAQDTGPTMEHTSIGRDLRRSSGPCSEVRPLPFGPPPWPCPSSVLPLFRLQPREDDLVRSLCGQRSWARDRRRRLQLPRWPQQWSFRAAPLAPCKPVLHCVRAEFPTWTVDAKEGIRGPRLHRHLDEPGTRHSVAGRRNSPDRP